MFCCFFLSYARLVEYDLLICIDFDMCYLIDFEFFCSREAKGVACSRHRLADVVYSVHLRSERRQQMDALLHLSVFSATLALHQGFGKAKYEPLQDRGLGPGMPENF